MKIRSLRSFACMLSLLLVSGMATIQASPSSFNLFKINYPVAIPVNNPDVTNKYVTPNNVDWSFNLLANPKPSFTIYARAEYQFYAPNHEESYVYFYSDAAATTPVSVTSLRVDYEFIEYSPITGWDSYPWYKICTGTMWQLEGPYWKTEPLPWPNDMYLMERYTFLLAGAGYTVI